MQTFECKDASSLSVSGHRCLKKGDVHIAIVDDDPLFRHAVKFSLEKLDGAEIYCYASGELFVREFYCTSPHIVILDYKLTDSFLSRLNGTDVIREVKKIDRDVRIILTTSQNSCDIAAETIRAGASEYVIKDHCTLQTLETHVTEMCSAIRRKRETRKEKTWIIACLVVLVMLVLLSAIL